MQLVVCCVCSLCTTDGELVKHKSELKAGGHYVAVGFGAHFRPLDYGLHGKPAFNASPRFMPKYVVCMRVGVVTSKRRENTLSYRHADPSATIVTLTPQPMVRVCRGLSLSTVVLITLAVFKE